MYKTLHTHPELERKCKVPGGHVIVDEYDHKLVLAELMELKAAIYELIEIGDNAREFLISTRNTRVTTNFPPR